MVCDAMYQCIPVFRKNLLKVCLKCWYPSAKLQAITFQGTAIFGLTPVDPVYKYKLHFASTSWHRSINIQTSKILGARR
jgi:hypothetical protein